MRDEESWLAEAAMHRILRRTLPAQRHEVLGALSALKLQLAVASRRIARAPGGGHTDGADTPAARLAQLQGMAEQQLAAQTALTALRLWDGLGAQRQPLADVLAQSLAWVRQAAAMRGHRLDDALIPDGATLPDVRVPAAHHLVLGLLYQTLDRLRSPMLLVPRLQPEGKAWRLSLDIRPRDDGLAPGLAAAQPDAHADAPPERAAQPPHLTAAMLHALARYMATPDGAWHCTAADRTDPDRACAGTPDQASDTASGELRDDQALALVYQAPAEAAPR